MTCTIRPSGQGSICAFPCHYLCSHGVRGLFVTKHGVDIARVMLNAMHMRHAAKVVKRMVKLTTFLYSGGRYSPHRLCAGRLGRLLSDML